MAKKGDAAMLENSTHHDRTILKKPAAV